MQILLLLYVDSAANSSTNSFSWLLNKFAAPGVNHKFSQSSVTRMNYGSVIACFPLAIGTSSDS